MSLRTQAACLRSVQEEAMREQVAVGRLGIAITEKRAGDLVLRNPFLVAWQQRRGEK